MTKEERQKEVSEWMQKLGFQDNSSANVPNFRSSLRQYVSPDHLMRIVAREYPDWNPVDDYSMISPQIAMLFYLAALDMVLEKTGNKNVK